MPMRSWLSADGIRVPTILDARAQERSTTLVQARRRPVALSAVQRRHGSFTHRGMAAPLRTCLGQGTVTHRSLGYSGQADRAHGLVDLRSQNAVPSTAHQSTTTAHRATL